MLLAESHQLIALLDSAILLQVAFQFLYTTVFGWLAAWYFVRYRHILAAVIPHAFCNYMGLPDISGAAHHRIPYLVLTSYMAGILGFTYVLLYQARHRYRHQS